MAEPLYTAIVLISGYTMLIMMVAVRRNSFIEAPQRRGFLALFLTLVVTNMAEWLAASLNGAPAAYHVLHVAAKFTELSLTPLVPAVCVAVFGGAHDIRRALLPGAAGLVLQVVSLFTGAVFSVDAANVYHRGPLYPVYMATFVVGVVLLLMQCSRFSRRYQNHNALFLTLIASLVLVAMALPVVESSLRLDWTCISLAAILFYTYYDELVQQVDALTSLLNRHSYDDTVATLRQKAVILFFDVDGFKHVNDTYGHPYGDECLKTLAGLVMSVFGHQGHCYRFGGDEFCVIMTREVDQAEALLSDFLHGLDRMRTSQPHLPRVSVGYAIYDPGHETVQQAVGRADEMMYGYKQIHHCPSPSGLKEAPR